LETLECGELLVSQLKQSANIGQMGLELTDPFPQLLGLLACALACLLNQKELILNRSERRFPLV
jgi:hypothetical protein